MKHRIHVNEIRSHVRVELFLELQVAHVLTLSAYTQIWNIFLNHFSGRFTLF